MQEIPGNIYDGRKSEDWQTGEFFHGLTISVCNNSSIVFKMAAESLLCTKDARNCDVRRVKI